MSTEREEALTSSERETERALRALRPAASGVDPLAVAFAAGAASARRSLWVWRTAAAVLCAALGVSILVRSMQLGRDDSAPAGTLIVRETVDPSATTTTTTTTTTTMVAYVAEPRTTGAYLRLRDQVLTHGFDALAEPIHAPSAAELDQPIPRAIDGGNWRPL